MREETDYGEALEAYKDNDLIILEIHSSFYSVYPLFQLRFGEYRRYISSIALSKS